MKLLVLVSFFLIPIIASPVNIDSLKAVLAKEKSLDKKIDIYAKICGQAEGKELLILASEFYNFSEINNSERGIMLASDNLGFYYHTSDPDSAIYFFNKAIAYYQKKKDPASLSNFYNQLGVCYFIKGDLNQALDNYLKCLKNIPTGKNGSEKGAALNNVAQIYEKLGQSDKALKGYKQTIDCYTKLGDKIMAAAINHNIGMIYVDKKQYDTAEKYLLIALNGIPQNHESYSQLIANLGLVYGFKGDLEKSKVYFLKAITLLRQENNQRGLAFVLANLGSAYSRMGRNGEAISCCLQAYKISEQLGFAQNVEQTSGILGEVYERTGDYKNALKYKNIFYKLRDSITSEKIVTQLNELNIKYESNKKDYELLKQGEEINKKEIQIQKQNVEAEKKRKYIFVLSLLGLFIFSVTIFVFRAYKQKQKANELISEQKAVVELQKNLIEEKQKEILDSIHYAKRIQTALLASENYIDKTIKKLKKQQ